MSSKYGKSDAARDTGSSMKDVGSAWHSARDDAQQSGQLSERGSSKSSSSSSSSSGKKK